MNFALRDMRSAMLVVLGLAGGPLMAAEDLSDSIYSTEFSAEEFNEIQTLLPENGGLNPAFVNSDTDPNIRLTAEAEIYATFIDEGAGYRNTFGYFVYDDNQNILYEQTIFSNASETGGGGSLNVGDTVSLGTFEAGTNIGFWLQADGFNNPDGHKYYTLDQYNPDGLRHMAIIQDPENERLILGFEDLYNLGDQDYNDLVFTFSASPYSAIDTSKIPTGSPEAGEVATLVIVAGLFAVYMYRRRELAPVPVDAPLVA